MRYLIPILAVLGLSLPALAAEQSYYVWVDENGITNYSERNPQGVDARYVGPGEPPEESRRPGSGSGRPGSIQPEAEPEPAASANQNAAGSSESEVDPDELVEEQRRELEQEIAQTKRQNCEMGRNNLARLTAYSRIRVEEEDGQERVLSEEERQSKIAEARQIVRDNCTG